MSTSTMDQMLIARRYAQALYETFNEAKKLKDLESNAESMRVLIEGSEDLRKAMTSPLFPQEQQAAAMAAIAKKAKYNKMFSDFLVTVSLNGRLNMLPAILKALQAIFDKNSGLETAEIISATTLTDKETKMIKDNLKKQLGKEVAVQVSVDDSLLGGVIMKIGSRMIDDSVKTKIERLERALRQGDASVLTQNNLKEVG